MSELSQSFDCGWQTICDGTGAGVKILCRKFQRVLKRVAVNGVTSIAFAPFAPSPLNWYNDGSSQAVISETFTDNCKSQLYTVYTLGQVRVNCVFLKFIVSTCGLECHNIPCSITNEMRINSTLLTSLYENLCS